MAKALHSLNKFVLNGLPKLQQNEAVQSLQQLVTTFHSDSQAVTLIGLNRLGDVGEDTQEICHIESEASTSADSDSSDDDWLPHRDVPVLEWSSPSEWSRPSKVRIIDRSALRKGKVKQDLDLRFPKQFTQPFVDFLRRPVGGMRPNASEIDSVMSKFLFYCNPEEVVWNNLKNVSKMSDWLYALESVGEAGSSLTNKVSYLLLGVKFYYYTFSKSAEWPLINQTENELHSWKKKYNKKKKIRNREIIEGNSQKGELPSLFDLNSIWENKELHKNMQDIISQAKAKLLTNPNHSYRLYLRYCLFCLVLTNSKREGVLKNLSLDDWKCKKEVDSLVHVTVSSHKTAIGGVSHVLISKTDEKIIQDYISYVRPFVTKKNTGYLFLTIKGEQISQTTRMIRILLSAYDKELDTKNVTITKIRKAYATKAIESGEPSTSRQVATLSDHSPATQQTYYDARMKLTNAVDGYKSLYQLRKGNL